MTLTKLNNRVSVYFNLTKKVYSVRDRVNGKYKITSHRNYIMMVNPRGHIQHGGRMATIKEGKKYVHAFIQGEIRHYDRTDLLKLAKITYNPFKYDEFKAIRFGELTSLNDLIDTLEGMGMIPVITMGLTEDRKPDVWLNTYPPAKL